MSERTTSELVESSEDSEEFAQLLASPAAVAGAAARQTIQGVVIGKLVAVADGNVAFVTFNGQQGTAAVRARAAVELRGEFVGLDVILMFEEGDPSRPLLVGCLQDSDTQSLSEAPNVEVAVDGKRLVVAAKDQLVLRCGQASITLTKAGKVLIEGAYVSSRSLGVNRIRGGSIQLN